MDAHTATTPPIVLKLLPSGWNDWTSSELLGYRSNHARPKATLGNMSCLRAGLEPKWLRTI